MLRLFLLISILFTSLIITTDVSAAVTYVPGSLIAMTGSNSDVRFDVAAPLMGYDLSGATLVTGTQTFTGAFYGSGIGWIMFSTGTYQVALDCGVQPLGNLTSDCTLTGTGWSENVGDIYFSSGTTVTYDHNTGYLSGSVISFAGNLSLSGIILPLRPITLNQTSMIADHNATLTVSGAWMYEGGPNSWRANISLGIPPQWVIGTNGIYTGVDFSLAGNYFITILDTNNSATIISGFPVAPGALATTLESSSFFAKTFCNGVGSGTTNCPDTTPSLTDDNRSATSLIQFPTTTLVANGTDAYNFTFKARDTYGNRVETGTVKIKYNTTVKNIQTDISDNMNYVPTGDGEAFISAKLVGGLGGSAELNTALGVSDITYAISSTAPTNTTDNVIQLNSITYTSGSSIILPFANTFLTFDPLYTASISAPTPTIDAPHTFTATVVKNDATTPITPTIINTLKVGALGTLAEWKDLSSIPGATCVNYQGGTGVPLCDWNTIDNNASIATRSSANYTFTGTYKLTGSFPPVASTTIHTYIYYQTGSTDILYSVPPTTIIPQAITPTIRLRILGQSGNWMSLSSQARVDFINSIRKNIALLSRNRTDYTNADHIISTGNKTISNADFSGNRRSIIVVGGDISITSNISKYTRPIAIIALADTNGNGGNITISGSVRDINSTLIAEHAITSETSSGQLYIHGSVISSNPPQDITPTTCPYFVTGLCTPADYDLPWSRTTYDFTAPNASFGGSTHLAPLVIETDPRLISDAPPAINK